MSVSGGNEIDVESLNDESNDGQDSSCISNDYFVSLIEKYGSPLVKNAHAPAVARDRDKALEAISTAILSDKATKVSTKKIVNKFQNLKKRAKKKVFDGKQQLLTKAEQQLLTFCERENRKPCEYYRTCFYICDESKR